MSLLLLFWPGSWERQNRLRLTVSFLKKVKVKHKHLILQGSKPPRKLGPFSYSTNIFFKTAMFFLLLSGLSWGVSSIIDVPLF